jgi:hypothetical protein
VRHLSRVLCACYIKFPKTFTIISTLNGLSHVSLLSLARKQITITRSSKKIYMFVIVHPLLLERVFAYSASESTAAKWTVVSCNPTGLVWQDSVFLFKSVQIERSQNEFSEELNIIHQKLMIYRHKNCGLSCINKTVLRPLYARY